MFKLATAQWEMYEDTMGGRDMKDKDVGKVSLIKLLT